MESTENLSSRPSPIRPQFQDAFHQGDAQVRLATPLVERTARQPVREIEPDWLAWEDTEIDIRRQVL